MNYSNPRHEATIEDWPSGRKRVTARFYTETNKRGQRVCRVTTGKPKKSTYSDRTAIVNGDDGRTYVLHSAGKAYGGFVSVMRGDMRFQEETRHPGDAGHSDLVHLLDAAA